MSPHRAQQHPGRYRDCRHPDCTAYRVRYQKRWTYDRAQGRTRTTDTAPVTRHVNTLIGAGWSLRSIAGEADTSASVISRLRDGNQATMLKTTAVRILAIDASRVPAKASKQTTEPFVPRTGSTRRIQALLFMGWSHEEMRRRSGVRTSAVLHQQGRWVTRTTHDKIAALYDQLWNQRGPSPKAHTYAVQRGYAGPLAWDDIDNDPAPILDSDPDVDALDETAIQRRMNGDKTVRLTAEEAAELVRRWRASGRPIAECQRITGLKPERYYRPNGRQEDAS